MWGGKRTAKERLHKGKKQSELVVTSLTKHKHTQVNYYPYESLIEACRNTTTTLFPTVTSAGDEDTDGDKK